MWVKVVLQRTVVGDEYFDNLKLGPLQCLSVDVVISLVNINRDCSVKL